MSTRPDPLTVTCTPSIRIDPSWFRWIVLLPNLQNDVRLGFEQDVFRLGLHLKSRVRTVGDALGLGGQG